MIPDESWDMTRREMLGLLAAVGGTAVLGSCSKQASPPPQRILGGSSREALSAAAERIFPGCVELGVFDFLEKSFEHRAFASLGRQFTHAGVVLNRLARSRYKRLFAVCSGSVQDELLDLCRRGQASQARFDSGLFFRRFVVLIVEGLFGDPRHGGNRHGAGWSLIGHEPCYFSPRRLELITQPNAGLLY